jgi:hypothetical protein
LEVQTRELEVRVGRIIEGSIGFVMDNWSREIDQFVKSIRREDEETMEI